MRYSIWEQKKHEAGHVVQIAIVHHVVRHVVEHVVRHVVELVVASLLSLQHSSYSLLAMSTQIPPSLQAVQKSARKPWKGCEYTVEERLILGQYKEIYRAKTTAGECRSVIQTQILVAIFNYWDSKGIVPDTEDTQDRIKVDIEVYWIVICE